MEIELLYKDKCTQNPEVYGALFLVDPLAARSGRAFTGAGPILSALHTKLSKAYAGATIKVLNWESEYDIKAYKFEVFLLYTVDRDDACA